MRCTACPICLEINLTEKRCCTCKEVKPSSEFNKSSYIRGGLQTRCRYCQSARYKEWRAAHQDYDKERRKKWRKENPEIARASDAANKHNRRVRGGKKISAATVSEIMEASGGVCPYCQIPIINGHLDHIVALSNGGTNAKENLVWVCAECNMQKANKPLSEWLPNKRAAMFTCG